MFGNIAPSNHFVVSLSPSVDLIHNQILQWKHYVQKASEIRFGVAFGEAQRLLVAHSVDGLPLWGRETEHVLE